MTLTQEEQRAIKALKRLEKIWPDTLWIFGSCGELTVLKYPEDRAGLVTPSGCVNQDYIVTTIKISADGGGW